MSHTVSSKRGFLSLLCGFKAWSVFCVINAATSYPGWQPACIACTLPVCLLCKTLNLNHRYDDAHPGEHPPAYDDGYGLYPQSPSADWEEEPPEGGWHDAPYNQIAPETHLGDAAPMQHQPGRSQRQYIGPDGRPRRNRRGGRRHRRPPAHPYAGYATASQLASVVLQLKTPATDIVKYSLHAAPMLGRQMIVSLHSSCCNSKHLQLDIVKYSLHAAV